MDAHGIFYEHEIIWSAFLFNKLVFVSYRRDWLNVITAADKSRSQPFIIQSFRIKCNPINSIYSECVGITDCQSSRMGYKVEEWVTKQKKEESTKYFILTHNATNNRIPNRSNVITNNGWLEFPCVTPGKRIRAHMELCSWTSNHVAKYKKVAETKYEKYNFPQQWKKRKSHLQRTWANTDAGTKYTRYSCE